VVAGRSSAAARAAEVKAVSHASARTTVESGRIAKVARAASGMESQRQPALLQEQEQRPPVAHRTK